MARKSARVTTTRSAAPATATKTKKTKCDWTHDEKKALLDVLTAEKTLGRMSDNGFKGASWTVVLAALAAVSPCSRSQRAAKSQASVLKRQAVVLDQLLKLSGFGYDSATGTVTALNHVWDDYLKAHPEAEPFRNTRFPYYDQVMGIYASVTATGENAIAIGGQEDSHLDTTAAGASVDDAAVPAESQEGAETIGDDSDASPGSSPAAAHADLLPEAPSIPALLRDARLSFPDSTSLRKRQRTTGAHHMAELVTCVGTLVNHVVSRGSASTIGSTPTAGPSTIPYTDLASPVRRNMAWTTATREENRSPASMATARKVLGQTLLADEYMSFGPDLRSARDIWMQREMDDVQAESETKRRRRN